MFKNNLRIKENLSLILIIYCYACNSFTMAKTYANKAILNSNLWTDWILVRSQNKNINQNDINNDVTTYNDQNNNKDIYSGITTYLNPSLEVYTISSSNLMKNNLNQISNNSLQIESKNNIDSNNNYPVLNWFYDRFKSIFQIIQQNNINDSSISKYLLDNLNTNDNTKRSFNEARKKFGKKYKKILLPLLLAYKLKFFTLIPVLIGGLILLVGTTGAAGFFFALFAAVMSLKPHDH